MKIKKINRIQRFGLYQNFAWQSDLADFSSFNVFYGWNYSGKTTLSRIFRCFELGKLHDDYTSCNFELEDFDGDDHKPTLFPNRLPIRVFNSDFIQENLKWNEGIEPIFLLGQHNIELQAELDGHKRDLATVRQEISELQEQKREKEQQLSGALSNRARELKHEYSIPVFDKRHFEPLVIEAHQNANRTLLSSQEIATLSATYYSTDKKATIDGLSVTVPDLRDFEKKIVDLLGQTVKAKVIERLKGNPALNTWMKQGKELHLDKKTCEFCGGDLHQDLLEHLNNHFSKDYDNLIAELSSTISFLERKKVIVKLPDSANLYTEFQQTYLSKKEVLDREIVRTNQAIDRLIERCNEKKLKVFEAVTGVEITDSREDLQVAIDDLNAVIVSHNIKTSEFDQQKQAAYGRLIVNFAVEFVVVHSYTQTLADIAALDQNIVVKNGQIPQLLSLISGLEQQLSETVKGADATNNYLKRYFGKDDIQIAVTSDSKFQLLRGGRVAKNLSEGEKTAIAFAYFMTRLQDRNTTFADTLVYIDDPISSLDSNHLFNTYSFIKDHFYEYDATTRQHTCKCAQFFISTHNYEFFNLIKDWYGKMKKTDTSFYLVARVTNTTTDLSVLRPLNSHLLKFKSEYSYLFSVLNSFKQNPVADFDQLYNLPNILRRFIESFTAFKYLSTRNIEENIEQLITNPVDCERVRKFVHYHTHSLSTTKLEQFSDLTECTGVIEIVTASLEALDPVHYASLLAENTVAIPTEPSAN